MSDSDDEYGPLQATWGSQTPVVVSEPTGWDSLKDPNAKLTEKGLGTGQLHRKGRNFKPIDEDIIISQRLNKNSSTKKKGNNNRGFSQDNLSTTKKTQHHRKTSLPSPPTPQQQYQKSKNSNKKPSFSTPTLPPMRPSSSLAGRISRPMNTNNAWSRPLVDTVFWENDLSNNNNNITSSSSSQSTHQNPTWSSYQSSNTANNTNNTFTTTNNNNNDTQHHHHHHQHHQHHQNNNGWGPPTARKAVNQKSDIKSSNSTTESWGPPQIASNGGWGNVDVTSKGVWSNDDDDKQQKEVGSDWVPLNKQHVSVSEAVSDDGNGWVFSNSSKAWEKPAPSNSGSKEDNSNGWGAPTSPTNSNSNNSSGWGSVNRATPSWMNSMPESPSDVASPPEYHRSPESNKRSGRFSNRSRKKYSDIPIEVPKPRNYNTSEPVSFPTAVAPPPPPDNDHLVTINVELSDTVKIPVSIRELDEPVQLAEKFAAEQNLQSPQVLQAIIKLFTSQKDSALLKKKQKLVKKYPSRPHPTSFYTEAFDYPEYLPTVYNNAPSLTTPFTRRAYY